MTPEVGQTQRSRVISSLKVSSISSIVLLFFACYFSHGVQAQDQYLSLKIENINSYIDGNLREPFPYAGLASVYNKLNGYVVNSKGIEPLPAGQQFEMQSGESLVIVGHYKVLILEELSGSVAFSQEKLLSYKSINGQESIKARALPKSDLNQLSKPFQRLKYTHLWTPLRWLTLGIEKLLLWLHSLNNFGWGITIIVFSLVFKILMLPVNIQMTRAQRKVSEIQAQLAPKLESIKEKYKGEEAHNKFLAAHKELGVSTFYNIKPLLLTMAPIPFWIAIFNALGEMDEITGHSFLWISDLSLPDAIYDLGINMPLLGSTVNLLPIIMTLVTIYASVTFQNRIVGEKELRKQKRNLILMAAAFFILFYPFPAAMVLYWTMANVWHLVQQRYLKI